MKTEKKNTDAVRKRYNRIAPIYDFMESLVEKSSYSRWRELLWSKAEGSRIVDVVGEGIERKEQLEFLEANNCDLVQGFYFSVPVSENKIVEMLKKNK